MGQILSVVRNVAVSVLTRLVPSSLLTWYHGGGANDGGDDAGSPPLLKPAMEGDLAAAKRLASAFLSDGGRDVAAFANRTDAAGNAAVHGAAFGGHSDVLEWLADACRADLSARNGMGCSPLWLAAGYGRAECLEWLTNRLDADGRLREDLYRNENHAGDSPLLAAASKGHVGICASLLADRDGVDPSDVRRLLRATNRNGDTVLTVAVSGATDEERCCALVDALCDRDEALWCDDDVRLANVPNAKGLTPLSLACERNLPRVVDVLVARRSASYDVVDDSGNTPLAVAAFCGNAEAVRALLQATTDDDDDASLANRANAEGRTPLWLACRTGNAKMAALLLEAGADPTLSDRHGTSPLDAARKYKKDKVVELLTRRTDTTTKKTEN